MLEAQVEDNSHRFDFKTHKEKEMLAFRKLFLVLALVSLTALGVSAANIPALQCVANAGVPPIVRAEGLAELVGDVVLNCTGGYPAMFVDPLVPGTVLGPASIPQVNVQIFLNTNITSRLSGDGVSSEALLMIDDPRDAEQKICTTVLNATNACVPNPRPGDPGNVYKPNGVGETTANNYNVWQGRQAQPNSIVWLGVPIDAPGTNYTRIIRITNVRAHANMLGVSSSLVPQNIIMYISITGSTSVPVNNPTQTVAWIQTGLSFSVVNAAGDGGAPGFTQCSSQYKDTFTDSTAGNSCPQTRVRFTEGFATAFKTRFSDGPISGVNQNNPSSIYNMSESGFFRATDNGISGWGSLAGWAGVATQGTRLRVTVANVPAGVKLLVTLKNVGATATNTAELVQVAADGSGNYVPAVKVASATTGCTWGTASGADIADLPIFGGTGSAVWEVTKTDPLSIQTMDFGLVVAYGANTSNSLPGLGTGTVNGMFAPVSTVTTASSTAPVPRFADTSAGKSAFTISQCMTNLLFPFVTNQAGFNTGIVIANTTKDPFGNAVESGTCDLYYYGDTNGATAPPMQTSAVVNGGEVVAWDLLGGGTKGMVATPNFQGYVIARCRFRRAHGYAFISDTQLQHVANGYLALILDASALRSGVSTSESLGQ
jgi:hypothetical protein